MCMSTPTHLASNLPKPFIERYDPKGDIQIPRWTSVRIALSAPDHVQLSRHPQGDTESQIDHCRDRNPTMSTARLALCCLPAFASVA